MIIIIQNCKYKQITKMGNYSNIPKRPPINFNPRKHQSQTTYVQRLKQTPFTNAEVYSLDPPIFTDPIDILLRDLVLPRVSRQQFFPPNQIAKIMSNIISGLAELQENQYNGHGDLSFETLYYDKRNKIFKIIHPIFSPVSGYQLSKQHKRFSLLSPEQLISLTDSQYQQPNIVTLKSDIFIFGILMLEVCTLLPSSQIYCPDTYIIFDKQIQNRIQLIRQFYEGQPLCQKMIKIITQLLEYDQNLRKSPKDILYQLDQLDPNKNQQVIVPQSGLPMRPNLIPANLARR